MKSKLQFIVMSGIIAAAYTALTYFSAMLGLAYGPVQFRLSEALCVLAAFTPAAIPGLTLGCLLGNLGSSLGPIDMLCGSAATLIAALIGYLLRKIRFRGIAWPALVGCILSNAVVVGAELALILTPDEAFLPSFALNAMWVAVGEIAVCLVAGAPLSLIISRNPAIERLLTGNK